MIYVYNSEMNFKIQLTEARKEKMILKLKIKILKF
jgi:hypothetical protein